MTIRHKIDFFFLSLHAFCVFLLIWINIWCIYDYHWLTGKTNGIEYGLFAIYMADSSISAVGHFPGPMLLGNILTFLLLLIPIPLLVFIVLANTFVLKDSVDYFMKETRFFVMDFIIFVCNALAFTVYTLFAGALMREHLTFSYTYAVALVGVAISLLVFVAGIIVFLLAPYGTPLIDAHTLESEEEPLLSGKSNMDIN